MSSVKLLIICTLLLFAITSVYAADKMMSVQVKETQVRATPTFLGSILATLAYGDRVEVLKESNGWAQVEIPGAGGTGWINLSALTEKRIVLKAGAEDVDETASSSEVALAGKGFNEEVEAEYKEDNDLDYTWVDRMEQIVFSPEELVSFLLEGGLTPAEGGAE